MRRTAFVVTLAALVGALVATPIAVYASHSFTDVPDTNTFHADIEWLADAGVTKGCNPPENTEFCPKENVTREQMAAFLRRLAENQVVDAATLQGLAPAELGGLVRAVHAGGEQQVEVAPQVNEIVRSVTVIAPVDGTVVANSSLMASQATAGGGLGCEITEDTAVGSEFLQVWRSGGVANQAQLAGTRGFDVTAGTELTINLVCLTFQSEENSTVHDSSLTAVFIASP